MDEHRAMLGLRILVIESDAALPFFDEAAVDVVAIPLHVTPNPWHPLEVVYLREGLPAFFGFVHVSGLSRQPELVVPGWASPSKPLFECLFVLVSEEDYGVAMVD